MLVQSVQSVTVETNKDSINTSISLDMSLDGSPWCKVSTTSILDPYTLDLSLDGTPWTGVVGTQFQALIKFTKIYNNVTSNIVNNIIRKIAAIKDINILILLSIITTLIKVGGELFYQICDVVSTSLESLLNKTKTSKILTISTIQSLSKNISVSRAINLIIINTLHNYIAISKLCTLFVSQNITNNIKNIKDITCNILTTSNKLNKIIRTITNIITISRQLFVTTSLLTIVNTSTIFNILVKTSKDIIVNISKKVQTKINKICLVILITLNDILYNAVHTLSQLCSVDIIIELVSLKLICKKSLETLSIVYSIVIKNISKLILLPVILSMILIKHTFFHLIINSSIAISSFSRQFGEFTVTLVGTFISNLKIQKILSAIVNSVVSFNKFVKVIRVIVERIATMSFTWIIGRVIPVSLSFKLRYDDKNETWKGQSGKYRLMVFRVGPMNMPISLTGYKWYLYYNGDFLRSGKALTLDSSRLAAQRIVDYIRKAGLEGTIEEYRK